ncbi:MAG: hypothetical protein ACLRXC_13170 [[Clostridium] leptum]
MLINAVLFEANWMVPYDESQVGRGPSMRQATTKRYLYDLQETC